MSQRLKEPHVLLASSNCQKLLRNLQHLIGSGAAKKIQKEINENVRALFELGDSHFNSALGFPRTAWRQRISRLYYAAYNIRRAIVLHYDGSFSTESSDHQKVDQLPSDFPNRDTYVNKLRVLRDDRNLADYSHISSEADLLIGVEEAAQLVKQFLGDGKQYLRARGLRV